MRYIEDWLFVGLAVVLIVLLAATVARAGDYPEADVGLVLAADVSVSMTDGEVDMQRKAYVNALLHPDLLQAVREGPHGRILVTYFEWAECDVQEVIVPWTVVEGEDDLRAVAAMIMAGKKRQDNSSTCIGVALLKAARLLSQLPVKVERMVVDVSGDGQDNNSLAIVHEARDRLVQSGVTINGLPIQVFMDGDTKGLAEYYQRNVVGGPGHFVEPASGVHDLERALRRKLVQEIG